MTHEPWLRRAFHRLPVPRVALVLLSVSACTDEPVGVRIASTEQSIVTVSRNVVVSGAAELVTLRLRDESGVALNSGGQAVAFVASGGTSTGILTPASDQGDGTFIGGFIGLAAGTATTIGATIDGRPVTSPLPTIQVVPGPASLVSSLVDVSPRTVLPGAGAVLRLTTRDIAGNVTGQGGRAVDFTASGGTGTGVVGPVQDHGDGSYTARFTATDPGTPLTVGATIDGSAVVSTLPTLTVAHPVSSASSVLTLSSDTISVNSGLTITLQVVDSTGVPRTSGGEAVLFQVLDAPATGSGTIGATTDHDDGSYTAIFTANRAGAPVGISATLNGTPLPGPHPTVTILSIPVSPQKSTVSVSRDTVQAGGTAVLTALVLDQAGDPTTSGITVDFALGSGGSSAGSIGPTTGHGDGTYTATFTGLRAGTPSEVLATINDSSQIQMLDSLGVSHLPVVVVIPGPVSPDSSKLSAAPTTVTLGDSANVLLEARDSLGNRLRLGGRAVTFERVGGLGKSVGTIRNVTDQGNGRYSAYYVADSAGTADTIRATIDGERVTSSTPTITVLCTAGPVSPAVSLITVNDVTAAESPVQHVTLPSGVTTTITLRARDGRSCPVTTPVTVQFSVDGGTSTGVLGPTLAQGDGTYTATYTGEIAGSADTVRATVDGMAVTSPAATIAVGPGDISPTTSVIAVSLAQVDSAAHSVVTLRGRDAAGNAVDYGGSSITFAVVGAPVHGSIDAVIDQGDGTYTAAYVAHTVEPGVPDTISARIGGTPVRTPLPGIEVVAGTISADQSVVTVSATTVAIGDSLLVTLEGRDARGRSLVTGDRPTAIEFTQSGGGSGVFRAVENNGDGSYSAFFVGDAAGSPTTIGATIGGVPLGTTLPTVTVEPASPSPQGRF